MGQAIGIDFGTTNTVVSYMNRAGNFKQLEYNGSPIIPSVIYFKSKSDYVIGMRAKNFRITAPKSCVENFKSHLGDKKFSYKVTAANGETFEINPRKATNLFLNKVVEGVRDKLFKDFPTTEEGRIDRAVITVPAKFNPKEIEIIKSAAGNALNIEKENIRLVYEPTAAAFAAQKDEGSSVNKVLIYDLGGGTFDVSLIRRDNERNKFVPVTTADGNKHLGGNLLTDLIAKKIMQWTNEELEDSDSEFTLSEKDYDEEEFPVTKNEYIQNIANVRITAEQIKEKLSETEEEDAEFNFWISKNESRLISIPVTRKEVEKIIKKEIAETVDITCNTIFSPDAKAIGEIDRIVLAGGSSKIPLIREMLADKLQRDDIDCAPEVYSLISRGAAILAQNITLQEDDEVEQVTNFQIGIAATSGMLFGKFEKIIPENEKLPYTATKDFNLSYDGQTQLDISYYEYDVKKYPNSKTINDDGFQEIDVLHVELPENLKKNNTIVRVEFKANTDGCLDITAQIFDTNGNKIKDDDVLKVNKESDLI